MFSLGLSYSNFSPEKWKDSQVFKEICWWPKICTKLKHVCCSQKVWRKITWWVRKRKTQILCLSVPCVFCSGHHSLFLCQISITVLAEPGNPIRPSCCLLFLLPPLLMLLLLHPASPLPIFCLLKGERKGCRDIFDPNYYFFYWNVWGPHSEYYGEILDFMIVSTLQEYCYYLWQCDNA